METMTMPVDATDKALEAEIAEARTALVDLARSDKERWWNAYELKVRARNGWSAGAMGLAMRELVSDGVFDQAPDMRVRLRQ